MWDNCAVFCEFYCSPVTFEVHSTVVKNLRKLWQQMRDHTCPGKYCLEMLKRTCGPGIDTIKCLLDLDQPSLLYDPSLNNPDCLPNQWSGASINHINLKPHSVSNRIVPTAQQKNILEFLRVQPLRYAKHDPTLQTRLGFDGSFCYSRWSRPSMRCFVRGSMYFFTRCRPGTAIPIDITYWFTACVHLLPLLQGLSGIVIDISL